MTLPLAAALTNLRHNDDFKLFMAAIAEDIDAETDRALASEGATCHRAQGATLKLRDIYKSVVTAPATLEKLQSSK